MSDNLELDKAEETDRATFLGAAAKVLKDSLESCPLFKGCVVIVISVVPDEDKGDILNMVSNAGQKSVPVILSAAYEKAVTSTSKLLAKPN